MGIIYNIRCKICHTEFSHFAGIGIMGMCIGCGELTDVEAPFLCPACNTKIDPKAPEFDEQLESTETID